MTHLGIRSHGLRAPAGPPGVARQVYGGQYMAASDEATKLLELFQVQHHEGPCLDAFRTSVPVVNADLREAADQWPLFAPRAAQSGFQSVELQDGPAQGPQSVQGLDLVAAASEDTPGGGPDRRDLDALVGGVQQHRQAGATTRIGCTVGQHLVVEMEDLDLRPGQPRMARRSPIRSWCSRVGRPAGRPVGSRGELRPDLGVAARPVVLHAAEALLVPGVDARHPATVNRTASACGRCRASSSRLAIRVTSWLPTNVSGRNVSANPSCRSEPRPARRSCGR